MTARIKASDLNDNKYHYSWIAKYDDDESGIREDSNIDELNRNQGYEMLYFINCFMENEDFKRRIDALEAERLIQEAMPHELRSYDRINEWLRNNWPPQKNEQDFED